MRISKYTRASRVMSPSAPISGRPMPPSSAPSAISATPIEIASTKPWTSARPLAAISPAPHARAVLPVADIRRKLNATNSNANRLLATATAANHKVFGRCPSTAASTMPTNGTLKLDRIMGKAIRSTSR